MGSEYDGLLELVRGRRSIRRFRDDPVPDDALDAVLEAARWAPSAGNRQPYRFLVVKERRVIDAMAEAVRLVAARVAAVARPDTSAGLSTYVESFSRFAAAPVVIAATYRDEHGDLLERVTAEAGLALPDAAHGSLASVAAAIANALLAAHALGLGTCWMTGPLVAADELERILAVPEGWSLAALVPIGVPAERPDPPPRRALSALVRRLGQERA